MSCSCKIGGGPDGVCFECKSRRAFHARLKKLEDAKASEEFERGIAEGERRERAAVVAWLRAEAEAHRAWAREAWAREVTSILRDRAYSIEAGEHKETT